jgi:hypothetical protein
MIQDYYGTKLVTAWPDRRGDEDGYAVSYEDGYISWSPKSVFEAAYQSLVEMSFGHAIEALRAGRRVARGGWNGRGMFLELQVPDENSKMSLPYIFMTTVQGDRVPWLASQTDMLAKDWQIV